MLFISKRTVFDKNTEKSVPLWKLETEEEASLSKFNTDTNRYEEQQILLLGELKSKPGDSYVRQVSYENSHVQFHVFYLQEYVPSKIQELLDSGEILTYLGELEGRVEAEIRRQEMWAVHHHPDMIAAKRNMSLLELNRTLNMVKLEIRDMVYRDMIYTM